MKLTEEHYILAEKICRREYEKRFNSEGHTLICRWMQ